MICLNKKHVSVQSKSIRKLPFGKAKKNIRSKLGPCAAFEEPASGQSKPVSPVERSKEETIPRRRWTDGESTSLWVPEICCVMWCFYFVYFASEGESASLARFGEFHKNIKAAHQGMLPS